MTISTCGLMNFAIEKHHEIFLRISKHKHWGKPKAESKRRYGGGDSLLLL
jgi:hypothetical protein